MSVIEDEGIRSNTQIQGQAPDGSLKNLRTNANGALKVEVEGGGSGEVSDVNVVNTDPIQVDVSNVSAIGVELENEAPIEVEVKNPIVPECVLASAVITAGTTATSVSVNDFITTMEVANYSEDADVTITIGQDSIVVGANIATELPINAEVTNISISASAANTKVYYLVKGVIEE